MSKAFTKDDDDEIPERVGRFRSSSGLPPGAINYMTAEGARLLREELAKVKSTRAAELRRMIDSATVVPERDEPPDEVLFGVTVHVRRRNGEWVRYRIVGVDETRLRPGWVSWVSPLGRALIGAQVGQQVHLPDAEEVEIMKIS